jgi:hypothetical protein
MAGQLFAGPRRAQCAAALLLFALVPAVAIAGTFEVKTPDIDKGQTELGANQAVFSRFPPNADPTRYSVELSAGYAPSEIFKIGAKVNLDQPIDEHLRASTVGIETQVSFGKPLGIALGWYTSVDARVNRDETNTVTFGPIVQFGNDKRSLTLNTFFAQTFGANRESGIAFQYAVQAKIEVQDGLGIGVEAYGNLPDIGSGVGVDFQEHRIGPVLYLDGPFGFGRKGGKMTAGAGDKPDDKGPKLSLEIGAFLGMTEATADLTGKFKATIAF